jgi:hypothetical protein
MPIIGCDFHLGFSAGCDFLKSNRRVREKRLKSVVSRAKRPFGKNVSVDALISCWMARRKRYGHGHGYDSSC